MDTAFNVLVIILSITLAIFLTLAIIATVAIIKLVQSVRRIASKGEHVIDSAESAAEMFKNAAGPLSAMRAITNIIETVTKHKNKGD
jgi:hypothetical protein